MGAKCTSSKCPMLFGRSPRQKKGSGVYNACSYNLEMYRLNACFVFFLQIVDNFTMIAAMDPTNPSKPFPNPPKDASGVNLFVVNLRSLFVNPDL